MNTLNSDNRTSRFRDTRRRTRVHGAGRHLAIALVLGTLMLAGTPSLGGAAVPPPAPWTASGPGTVTVVSNGTTSPAQMTYSLRSTSVYAGQNWTFSTTASSGPVTLNWNYTGFHAYYQVTAFLRAYVIHNSVTTYTGLVSAGPENCCTAPSGGFNYSGSVTLNVQPGDTYGFQFGGRNYDSNDILQGQVTVKTVATSMNQCKTGGWQTLTDATGTPFNNQGDCVSYVETGGSNPANG